MDIYFVYPFSSQCITYYITSILNPALQGDLKPIKLQLSLLIDPLNNGQLHPFVRWCKTFVYGMKIAATLVICFFLEIRYTVLSTEQICGDSTPFNWGIMHEVKV